MKARSEPLFAELSRARYGENRRRRAIFIPKHVADAVRDGVTEDDDFRKAHDIVKRWADLETSGALDARKESEVEAEFLYEVFGEALGYVKFSSGSRQWNLQPKFPV